MIELFNKALDAIRRRKVNARWLTSRDWGMMPNAIRQKSFFSARTASARVLSNYRRIMEDWLSNATEEVITPQGEKVTAYKQTGQAEFVERAREILVREGLATKADIGEDKAITNLASGSRLRLIYNTNIMQSAEFSAWQMRMSDPDYLNRWPAAQFVRTPGAQTFRQRHVEADGKIRRWDDFDFWLKQNSREIGGFGVPWGPWGFNSWMSQEPVSRKKAIQLRLIKPNEKMKIPNAKDFGADLGEKYLVTVDDDIGREDPAIAEKTRADIRARFGQDALKPDGTLTLATFKKLKKEALAGR